MVIIPNRLHWKHCSVLCCLATSDSAACYFQHLSLSVWTPFSCTLYFCGPRSNTQETFLPVFPNENVCLSAATFHRCSSFYPHLTQREGVKHSTMALWAYYFVLSYPADIVVYLSVDLHIIHRFVFFSVGIESTDSSTDRAASKRIAEHVLSF